MNDLVALVFIAQTTAYVVASLLLVYPVVAYAQNVAHTRGLLFLAGSFLILTVSYVVWVVFEMVLLSSVLDFASAVLAAMGVWQFARPFVRFGDEELETPTVRESSGGFESAGDD